MQRYLYFTLHQGPYSTALPGVSLCGPAALAEAAGDVPNFQEHLATMQQSGVLLHEGRLFVLPDVLAEATPANPNAVKAWRAGFDELPCGLLKQQIDATIRQLLITHGREHPVKFDGRPPDPYAYIRAWDPTFTEHSANVIAMLPQRPPDVPLTLAKPGSGTGPGTATGPGMGTEPQAESEPGSVARVRKGSAEGEPRNPQRRSIPEIVAEVRTMGSTHGRVN
jgi:hypothetical protein